MGGKREVFPKFALIVKRIWTFSEADRAALIKLVNDGSGLIIHAHFITYGSTSIFSPIFFNFSSRQILINWLTWRLPSNSWTT